MNNVFFEARKLGLFMDVQSSADVDTDMCFMWSASHLALSNSRFSALIAECACAHEPTGVYTFVYKEFTKDEKLVKLYTIIWSNCWLKNSVSVIDVDFVKALVLEVGRLVDYHLGMFLKPEGCF